MRRNKLRELLNEGKPTLGTHIHSTWPSVVEAIGHTGLYDYVEFVAEYGPFDLHDLDNLGRAADLYGMSSMIKVDQEPRGFIAQRAIGSGFQSVLFADCHTVEDVKECVKISRPDTPKMAVPTVLQPAVSHTWGTEAPKHMLRQLGMSSL